MNEAQVMSHATTGKLVISLEPNAWHGYATETVWVRDLGEHKYQLLNTPFFAKQLSYEDIVIAAATELGLIFQERISSSGHSTYRIIPKVDLSTDEFLEAWASLAALGCTYEELALDFRLLAVDVPPSADIYRVYEFLEIGEHSNIWDFEEGHCAHVVNMSKH
ncbi:MAG: DUF4265 domain-containing protein [Sulfuritalea sp.]|nr:DUF4265 domain-containing protein [Sulfuritalea sp.]